MNTDNWKTWWVGQRELLGVGWVSEKPSFILEPPGACIFERRLFLCQECGDLERDSLVCLPLSCEANSGGSLRPSGSAPQVFTLLLFLAPFFTPTTLFDPGVLKSRLLLIYPEGRGRGS